MPSTVSAARAALFALLDAAPAFDGVQVTFGPPDAVEEQEVVALLGVEDPTEEPSTIGNNRRREEYILEVGVKAHDPSGDAPTVDARGFALLDAVIAVIDNNITLSDTVRTAWVVSTPTDGVRPADGGGWVFFARVRVLCKADRVP